MSANLENVARKIVALGDEQLAIADLQNGLSQKGTEFAQNQLSETTTSLKVAVSEVTSRRTGDDPEAIGTHRWNRKRTARELQISYRRCFIN